MPKYALGIDIGTTSICALAYDIENKKALCAKNTANDSPIASPDAFARMQKPERILEVALSLVDAIEKEFGLPVAVGFSGQMHGILYIDKDGNPVSPLYTWQDARGAQEMNKGETYVEYIRRMTGYPVSAGYGLVTHFYNTKNNLVPVNANKITTIHDFLAMKMAGRTTPVMHASDAASLGIYKLKENVFDVEAYKSLGMDEKLLPEVTTLSQPIGSYKGNIPVYPALGDNQASFLGTAGAEEGTLLVNIGTGSQVSIIGEMVRPAQGVECRPFINGKYLLVGSSLCGGRAYAVLEKFFRAVANMCGANIKSAYPFMDKFMETWNTEDAPLTVSTLFDGTRADPTVRGNIDGVSVTNLEPGAMMQGFMNGIADELNDLFKTILSTADDLKVENMIGAGNGLRVNPTLCAIVEEKFGMPLKLSNSKEEAALGAALFTNL